MSRENVRAARQPGHDPRAVLLIGVAGVVVSVSLVISVVVTLTTPAGTPVPWNPLRVVVALVKGRMVLHPSQIMLVIALWLVGVCAVVVGWWLMRVRRGEKKRIDEAARYLASEKDIESMSRRQAQKQAAGWFGEEFARKYPGLRIGHVAGRKKKGVFSTWEDLYLVIFGPRMGKTTSQVIPAIVDAPGPVVATSNKADLVYDTQAVARERGEVWVFDPQGIAARYQQRRWFFDPLDMVRRQPEAMDSQAMALADIFKCAARGEDAGGDAFFTDGGRDLLGRLLLAAALDDRPIGDVFIWANDDSDRTPVGILGRWEQWSQQARALEATYTITEKTRSGLFSQAAQMAAPLGRRQALEWVTPSVGVEKFSPEEFVRSGHDTLYLLSKEGADNAAALTTALTAAVMKAAEAYGEANGGRLPVPIVAALDEAANVVRWPELPDVYSHYGSRGIILMTILQSYSQGEKVWGAQGMETLWSAASILVYGGGVRDDKMLGRLEHLIGDMEVQSRSVSRSAESRSVSTQVREKKIVTVAELASLQAGRAIVFAAKRRPIVVALEPWWEREWDRAVKDALGSPAGVITTGGGGDE